MKKSEFWASRKGFKMMLMGELNKKDYNGKLEYLERLCGNGTNYDGFKFYYNEKWDIKIRVFHDSSYDMI